MNVKINEQSACGLIDSGCTQTLVGSTIRTTQASERKRIITGDGKVIDCQGKTSSLCQWQGKQLKVLCVAIQKMLPSADIVIGIDRLKHFKFCLEYKKFCIAATAVSNKIHFNLTITKNYFKVNFVGEKWVAKWNWIKNQCYTIV